VDKRTVNLFTEDNVYFLYIFAYLSLNEISDPILQHCTNTISGQCPSFLCSQSYSESGSSACLRRINKNKTENILTYTLLELNILYEKLKINSNDELFYVYIKF